MQNYPVYKGETMTFVQQGWQCPVCKHVYNPSIPKCQYCGNVDSVATEETANPYIHPHDIFLKDPITSNPTQYGGADVICKSDKKFS